MTQTPATFDQYREQMSETDANLWLGKLAWYAVSENTLIDHADFCRSLVEHGIEMLPSAPRPSDVFKRACTASQRKRVQTGDPNVRLNFLIRDVGMDNDNIWRRLVEERVDSEGHRLSYTEVYELHFRRSTQVITTTLCVPQASREAYAIVANVRSLFESLNNTLTTAQLRVLIRNVFQSLNATIVRPSGGVYFVRGEQKRIDVLDNLELVVNALPGAAFHSLPLLDDGKQREMLRRAFEDESVGEVDGLLAEITEILRGDKKITSDKFADLKVKKDYLFHKMGDYSDLLDTAMVETASRLEILDETLFELLGKVNF